MPLLSRGSDIFVGTSNGVFRSTDNGTNWNAAHTGLDSVYVYAFAVSDSNLFAGTGVGMYLSTNKGGSWNEIDNGLAGVRDNLYVNALAISGTTRYAGTDNGVFRSTNNGTSWTPANSGLAATRIEALAIMGNTLFAATSIDGVIFSTDNGSIWSAVNMGTTSTYDRALAVSGKDLLLGTSAGVAAIHSTDNGVSWNAVDTKMPEVFVDAVAISGSNLFAATYGNGVWRRPLSELVVSAERATFRLPEKCTLEQNFPNPFNPSTVIRYTITGTRGSVSPSAGRNHVSNRVRDGQGTGNSDVRLVVYDILGREVAMLVNEKQAPGTYEVKLDGTRFASGMYFYRLQSGKVNATKAMLLVQ